MDLALEADVADSGAVAAALAGAEARLGPLRYAVTAAGYYDRVVLLASEWGVTGWPNATAYAASKGGLVSLVKSAARALAADGVAVNAIAPGVTDTLLLEVDAADAGGLPRRDRRPLRARRPARARRATGGDRRRRGVPVLGGSDALVGQVLRPNGGTTRAWA